MLIRTAVPHRSCIGAAGGGDNYNLPLPWATADATCMANSSSKVRLTLFGVGAGVSEIASSRVWAYMGADWDVACRRPVDRVAGLQNSWSLLMLKELQQSIPLGRAEFAASTYSVVWRGAPCVSHSHWAPLGHSLAGLAIDILLGSPDYFEVESINHE